MRSDPVRHVGDDFGLHQLLEKLFLLADVVRPGLSDKHKQNVFNISSLRQGVHSQLAIVMYKRGTVQIYTEICSCCLLTFSLVIC